MYVSLRTSQPEGHFQLDFVCQLIVMLVYYMRVTVAKHANLLTTYSQIVKIRNYPHRRGHRFSTPRDALTVCIGPNVVWLSGLRRCTPRQNTRTRVMGPS